MEAAEDFGYSQYNSLIVEPCSHVPPWQPPPKCDLSMIKFTKRDTAHVVLQQEYETLKEIFWTHKGIYTDGSNSHTGVSCAMVTEPITYSHSLNKMMSVFTAEVYAVVLALNYIIQSHIPSSVIYTDSLSVVQATLPRIYDTLDR